MDAVQTQSSKIHERIRESALVHAQWYQHLWEIFNLACRHPKLSGSLWLNRIAQVLNDLELHIIRDHVCHPPKPELVFPSEVAIMKSPLASELLSKDRDRILDELMRSLVMLGREPSLIFPKSAHEQLQQFIWVLIKAAHEHGVLSGFDHLPTTIKKSFWRKSLEVSTDEWTFFEGGGIKEALSRAGKVSLPQPVQSILGSQSGSGMELQVLEYCLQMYQKVSRPKARGVEVYPLLAGLLKDTTSEPRGSITPEVLKKALLDPQFAKLSKDDAVFYYVFLYQIWVRCGRFQGDQSLVATEIKKMFNQLADTLELLVAYLEFRQALKGFLWIYDTRELTSGYYVPWTMTLKSEMLRFEEEFKTIDEIRQICERLQNTYPDLDRPKAGQAVVAKARTNDPSLAIEEIKFSDTLAKCSLSTPAKLTPVLHDHVYEMFKNLYVEWKNYLAQRPQLPAVVNSKDEQETPVS